MQIHQKKAIFWQKWSISGKKKISSIVHPPKTCEKRVFQISNSRPCLFPGSDVDRPFTPKGCLLWAIFLRGKSICSYRWWLSCGKKPWICHNQTLMGYDNNFAVIDMIFVNMQFGGFPSYKSPWGFVFKLIRLPTKIKLTGITKKISPSPFAPLHAWSVQAAARHTCAIGVVDVACGWEAAGFLPALPHKANPNAWGSIHMSHTSHTGIF